MGITFDPDKIITRLKFFNYKYELEGTVLKVKLPLLCFLKIDYSGNKVKMTSGNWLDEKTLEYGLLATLFPLGMFLYFDTHPPTYKIIALCVFILLISYHITRFIKVETMKIIVHNWIERDSLEQGK